MTNEERDDWGHIVGDADISACGKYRWSLRRRWADVPRFVLWLMLNPSTADATKNDNTVRRCIAYAKAWGYTGILVGNLYAFRSSKPVLLRAMARSGFDVVGAENDAKLAALIDQAALIVCAWGSPGPRESRHWDVLRMLHKARKPAHYLRLNHSQDATMYRHPSHPLRLRRALEPIRWEFMRDDGPGAGG